MVLQSASRPRTKLSIASRWRLPSYATPRAVQTLENQAIRTCHIAAGISVAAIGGRRRGGCMIRDFSVDILFISISISPQPTRILKYRFNLLLALCLTVQQHPRIKRFLPTCLLAFTLPLKACLRNLPASLFACCGAPWGVTCEAKATFRIATPYNEYEYCARTAKAEKEDSQSEEGYRVPGAIKRRYVQIVGAVLLRYY